MSWSVGVSGTAAEIRGFLEQQFQWPLAEKPAGLSDDGERETVHRVKETIFQVLRTYDPKRLITVSAYGHMGFSDWATKSGAYQQVSITVNDVGYPPEPAALEPEAAQDAPSVSVDVSAVDVAPDAAEAPAAVIEDGPTANT